jgi:NAD(P)-dependent dehydrogenase (short-subunit alcohol dehydrogenase family)
MSDYLQLAGLRAFVTGGTQGIGAAVAARLHDAGATVLTTARNFPGHAPEGIWFAAADLSTSAGCATAAAAVQERLGSVDIVVHV